MKKIILCSICFLAVFEGYGEEIGKIVAKVNNLAVTAKDLDDYYKMLIYKMPGASLGQDETKGKQEALIKLIEDRLILAEAKKQNLSIPPYLVNEQLDKIIASYPSREDFENSLLERGLTVTVLKERIQGQILMRQMIDMQVGSYITVSPQEINRYYEEHKNEIVSAQKYLIWIAQSKDKNKIVKIAQTVKDKGIVEARKDYPDDFIMLEAAIDELKEEIADGVGQLKPGEHTIKTIENTAYLVYFEKDIPSRPLEFREAQESIRTLIWNNKFRARFSEWVKQLKDKAIIKTYL